MKKNLRIVSAAAAALLAVAPVAAAAVVSPATTSVAHAADSFSWASGTVVPSQAQDLKSQSYRNKQVRDTDKDTIAKIGVTAPTGSAVTRHFYKNGTTNDLQFNFAGFTNANGKNASDNNYKVAIGNAAPVKLSKSVSSSSKVGDLNTKKNTTYTFTGYERFNITPDAFKDASGVINKNATSIQIGSNTYPVKWDGNMPYTVISFTKTVTFAKKSAATTPEKPDTTTPSENVKGLPDGDVTTIFDPNSNVDALVSSVSTNDGTRSAITGSVTVNLDGASYKALLHGNPNFTVYQQDANYKWTVVRNAAQLESRTPYVAELNDVTVTLPNKDAGQTKTFTLGRAWFNNAKPVAGAKYSDYINGHKDMPRTMSVKVGNDGVAHLGNIMVPFHAYDAADLQELHFYNVKTGNQVTSGSVDLHAVNGQLNVEAVRHAIQQEYEASQLADGPKAAEPEAISVLNDLKDQITKAGYKVDQFGYFKAPSSFTVNMNAVSMANGAKATLPVTVNVDNAAAQTPANEQTTTKTIMHIATLYDKNGKATNDPALRAYNSVSVVTPAVPLKDASGKVIGNFYKLAGQDRYIKVGNIDGTSRSLKHNAYVYKANGKAIKVSKKHHKVLKNGASVTTYGKSFKNDVLGTQVYRIGRNQYVKVANFR